MITSIYQEVELSLTENLIPVTVPVKQYDNRARKVRCVLYNNSVQILYRRTVSLPVPVPDRTARSFITPARRHPTLCLLKMGRSSLQSRPS